VVLLNGAVAVGMSEGPGRGLSLIDGLGATGALDRYHLYHAARADLLRRLGEREAAAGAYRRALALTANRIERSFLERRLAALKAPPAVAAPHQDVPLSTDASPNSYAHPGFERAGRRRRDSSWILERIADPGGLFVPVWRNQNLVFELEGGAAARPGTVGPGPTLGRNTQPARARLRTWCSRGWTWLR
jgi:hypothetical protein